MNRELSVVLSRRNTGLVCCSMAVVADGAGSGTGSLTRPVTLNIGGEKLIAVSPGLFDLLGENKISSMLSGCWEVLRDADDSIFLDYSPEVFMQLVEWLRHRRDSSPGTEVPVDVEPRYMAIWVCMMKSFSVELEQLLNAGVEKKVLRRCGYPKEQLRKPFAERDARLEQKRKAKKGETGFSLPRWDSDSSTF